MESGEIVNLVLNFVSIVLGLVTVVLVARLECGELSGRASVQFTLVIGLVDVFKSSSIILMSFWKPEGRSCQMVGFFVAFGILAHIFLNGALGLNLYLMFVKERGFSVDWLKYYICVALGTAFLLSVALLVLGMYPWKVDDSYCELRDLRSVWDFVAMWMFFMGWILLVCVFNFVVVCLSLYKLWTCQFEHACQSLVLRV
ncbi:hypothetical protein DSO57_1013731 [Entomophthora muscae]|uniref:Uncharacterized protein n=1 Tax=Entomophthora muscae TaxID=34485 RepID=A0ACC2UR93_9FUNG|nr:hypothetical protein DSO57_1013731 [Entomophthora muscae]